MAGTELPADLPETPDRDGSYPRLGADQLALLERHGVRRAVVADDVLFREGDPGYDFFAVTAGRVAVVEDVGRAGQRVLSVSGAGRFLGELNLLGHQPVYLTAVVTESGEVLDLDREQLHAAFRESPQLHDLVLRTYLLRRANLLAIAADLRIIGRAGDENTALLRAWADDHGVAHSFTDLEQDDEARTLLGSLGLSGADTPIAAWRDGRVLRNPTLDELRAATGPG